MDSTYLTALRRTLLAVVAVCCFVAAGMVNIQAALQLVENFQDIPNGPLNGQKGWSAALTQVKADPAQAGNKVASFEGAGAAGANLPLSIPEGTSGTLFFRAYSEADTTLVDWFAGMSDVAVTGVGVFNDFEAQIGYSGSQILDTLRVRDGSTRANEAAGEFLPRTWYKIWAVIDNAADTYEVYIKGGSFTDQTQVAATSTGNTSFVFRNSTDGPVANNLVRFFVKSGTATLPGPALLDDIYFATGTDLSDPVPDSNVPPTVSITAPADGATFSAPANIAISVNATDTDGTISTVEFFEGTTLLGADTSSPYSFTWSNVAAGFYNLTVKATDNTGATSVSGSIAVTVNPTGTNNFKLLDSFESATVGELNGQNNWTAARASVIVDPTQANNKVASFEGASGGASLPAVIREGGTGTLFFRVYSVSDTTDVDWCAGASDMGAAGPGRPYSDFEAQVCVAGSQTPDMLKVRDGTANANVDIEEFRPRTWYKIWLVINNEIDQVEVYMQGGQLAEPTLLEWEDFNYTSFVFRNSAIAPEANDLVRFLVLTATGHNGQFLLDDVYIDQFGKNLNDPVGALSVLPTVTVTAPAEGAEFTAPANVTISADASRAGGTIAQVEFFAEGTLIGSDNTSPYSVTWSNVGAGKYSLTAKATDNQGSSQISAPVSITVNPGAGAAGFQLVENFEQTTPGDLNGQRGWSAAFAQVKADPENAANQVASFEGAGDGGANRPLLIPEGETATLFFRFYTGVDDPALRDWWAGVSDVNVSGVGAFGDFETQVGVTGGAPALRVRDGTAGEANNVDVDEHLPFTWYKIWAVIDNSSDTYQVFVQGGSLATQTQVDRDSNGRTEFVFRNSGGGPVANDLIRFFVKGGTATRPGPVLLDDVYLASGRNLTDPTAGATPPLRVEITKQGGEVTLTWQGNATLQASGEVNTGYADVAGAQSPFRVDTSAATQRFYRLRQ